MSIRYLIVCMGWDMDLSRKLLPGELSLQTGQLDRIILIYRHTVKTLGKSPQNVLKSVRQCRKKKENFS